MKNRKYYLLFIIILFVSCSKEDDEDLDKNLLEEPKVSTKEISEISTDYVLVTGELITLGDYDIIDHGFVLAEQPEPTLDDIKLSLGSIKDSGDFKAKFENLESNTNYFIRAYISYGEDQVIFGNVLSFTTLQSNIWEEKASFAGDYLAGAVSFVTDDKLFVGTGVHDSYVNHFYEYNYQLNRWKRISDLPADPRSHAIAFSIGNFGYVGLGVNCTGSGIGGTCNHNYFNDLWKYNPEDGSWTKMADFPGAPRAFSSCFVIGDKAYVTGGSSVDNYDLWEYDATTDTWAQKANYPGSCSSRGISFSINGKGYVGFGWTDKTCNDFWEYDPATDVWTEKASFPGKPRYSGIGFSLMDKGFVACGLNQGVISHEYLTDVWKYEPVTDKWTKIDTNYAGKGRVEMIVGVIENKVIMGLGAEYYGSVPRFDDIWEYVPENN